MKAKNTPEISIHLRLFTGVLRTFPFQQTKTNQIISTLPGGGQ